MTSLIRVAATSESVEAEVVDPATQVDLNETQRLWEPVLRSVAMESAAQGETSGIKVWQGDWRPKGALLASADYSIQGLRMGGRVQGLIKMIVGGEALSPSLTHRSKLIYVDLVEVAPWNVRRYMNALDRDPVYKDVGQALIRLAVGESARRGNDGKIGLHSIPRAEGFYETLGMTQVGMDPNKEGLVYFEFDSPAALRFYEGR